MKWIPLNSESQFDSLLQSHASFAVFKHSTRCSISSMAKNRLERECGEDVEIYYLDLIAFRNLSNYISAKSGVVHESPQLIIFKDGKAIADASHIAVRGEMTDLLKD